MAIASSFWFWDRPSWGEAELWALLFLLIPSFFIPIGGQRLIAGLVLGRNNRWSTSKFVVVLWTYALLFAFVAILLHTRGRGLDNIELADQYLLLFGIPVAVAIAVSWIRQTRERMGTPVGMRAAGPPNALDGTGQLITDEAGVVDLVDFQYFVFNLLLVVYFLLQFVTGESPKLPELPGTLVGLMAVSAVAYVVTRGFRGTNVLSGGREAPPPGPR